jgi:hypothetical protein
MPRMLNNSAPFRSPPRQPERALFFKLSRENREAYKNSLFFVVRCRRVISFSLHLPCHGNVTLVVESPARTFPCRASSFAPDTRLPFPATELTP